MPTKFEAPMCEAKSECEGWKLKGSHLTYTRKSGEHAFYVSAYAIAPEGYKMTEENAPHEMGFLTPYMGGQKTEMYWAGMTPDSGETGKAVELYNTTILAEIPYKEMLEIENMDEKDARLTYETYWKKTDFSIKSKRGKSMMHSSAWRPLMPASKKDAKMLEWKLKGNTKL